MTGFAAQNFSWFFGFSKMPFRKIEDDYCDCKGIVGDCGRCDGACQKLGGLPDILYRSGWFRDELEKVSLTVSTWPSWKL